MAFIKTDNPIDFSGGDSCHGPTAPLPSQKNVKINGNGIMLFVTSGYGPGGCIEGPHARLCLWPIIGHPNLRVNGTPVFTSDDFVQCAEPAGAGIFPVFAN